MKRVTDDLGREMARPLSSAHLATCSEWAERGLAVVGMSGDENELVKSSAYDVVNWGEGG